MRPKRIKVHPIGYKKNTIIPTKDHTGETFDHIQTIIMADGEVRVIKHYKVHALGGLHSQV